jgi:hypothetical protein
MFIEKLRITNSMKKLNKIWTLAIILLVGSELKAQVVDGSFGYFNDALRFSQTQALGTARMQAIGGAQIALGGDPTSAFVNPAGLGFYTRSTFTFSPSFGFNDANAIAFGETTNDYRGNLNVSNLGMVFAKASGDIVQNKFKGGSFAVTLNRINDFNRNFTYEGYNDENSIIDFFIQSAAGIDPNNIDGRGPVSLAYYNYLINPIPDSNGDYDSFIIGFPKVRETVETRGAQYQWNLSYGGNYDDKLYFGGGLGISTVRYSSKKTYLENSFEYYIEDEDRWVADDVINNVLLEEKLAVDGVGVNATIGLIYRINDIARVGLTYTSPSFYTLNDESSSALTTDYNNFYFQQEDTVLNVLTSESDIVISSFTLQSPARLGLGGSFFIGKYGFLSADVEFLDYRSAVIRSRDFSPSADNETIRNLYRNTVNLRVGGEFRIEEFRVRAGYNYTSNPYTSGTSRDAITAISGGIGYRVKEYFVDLAIVNRSSNQFYSPYSLTSGAQPVVDVANRRNTAVITVGFNF